MNFEISNPQSFLLFVPLILATLFLSKRYAHIKRVMSEKNCGNSQKIDAHFWMRTAFRFFSASTLIFALAGISWGTSLVPVQRSGKCVCFVFDISYSMQAHDAPGKISRLEAASQFALDLLDFLDDVKISIVLTKGEGIVALPLTDDSEAAKTLIECLSPNLITAPGSSLGNGVRTAISSFPENSGAAPHIWLFTDGDETDDSLESSLFIAQKLGIPVGIIGFGSKTEIEVLAGDGQTFVKTALRTEKIKKIISSILKNTKKNSQEENIFFIEAVETGCATKLLKPFSAPQNQLAYDVTYEIQKIKRHKIFIFFSILFLILSFVFGEAGNSQKIKSVATIIFCAIFFSSCSKKFSYGTKILAGKIAWNKGEFPSAVADFLEAATLANECDDKTAQAYALFALGTTYLAQGERAAANQKFQTIFENKDFADDFLKFSLLYNVGIIAHMNGDFENATSFFRRALELDPSNTNAKLNLELSVREKNEKSSLLERNLFPVAQNSDEQNLESSLYSIIREEEKQQWKNMQAENHYSAKDY